MSFYEAVLKDLLFLILWQIIMKPLSDKLKEYWELILTNVIIRRHARHPLAIKVKLTIQSYEKYEVENSISNVTSAF